MIKKVTAIALAFIIACIVVFGGFIYLLYLMCNTDYLDGVFSFITKL